MFNYQIYMLKMAEHHSIKNLMTVASNVRFQFVHLTVSKSYYVRSVFKSDVCLNLMLKVSVNYLYVLYLKDLVLYLELKLNQI